MNLYKYHGAGNSFLIINNLSGDISISKDEIIRLCNKDLGIGADGLMILEKSDKAMFRMVYYNSDGSTGMMCGNGGRCIVDFANFCGIEAEDYVFEAADGLHYAKILSKKDNERIISLKMINVNNIKQLSDNSFFLDTGTRHYVEFKKNISNLDVVNLGSIIRYDDRFKPIGTNVNFASLNKDFIEVRTYEKGVENETLACGTGIVATAISAFVFKGDYSNNKCDFKVKARCADLSVRFSPIIKDGGFYFEDVWLIGPSTYVAKIII